MKNKSAFLRCVIAFLLIISMLPIALASGALALTVYAEGEVSEDGTTAVETYETDTVVVYEGEMYCTHEFSDTVTEATCTSDGYTLHECTKCGYAYKTDIIKGGHRVEKWDSSTEPSIDKSGRRRGTCSVCGERITEIVPSLDSYLPKVYLSGEAASVTKNVITNVTFKYVWGDTTIESYATVEGQGASSAGYKDKSMNLRLYTNKSRTTKNKIDLGWGKESKYTLKSNHVDATEARNVVSGKIWGDIVRSRVTPNSDLSGLTNGGAIDGYPIVVYIGDSFHGLYTLNIPKDEWSFEEGGNDIKAMVANVSWTNSGNFLSKCARNNSDWKLKYADYDNDKSTDDTRKAFNALDDFLEFVMNNDGQAFVDGIETYLDIDSAIDYLLMMYFTCAADNESKNMIMVTYDGVKWIMSIYDYDGTWGMHWSGGGTNKSDGTPYDFYEIEERLPYVSEGMIKANIRGNALWDKILNLYTDRICERYFELRRTYLSMENIYAEFSDFVKPIPREIYEADWAKNGIPSTSTNTIDKIVEYITARSAIMDDFFRSVYSKNNNK